MSATKSTPVAKRIAQAALIVRLQDAIDGCDTVERIIGCDGSGDWVQGRAEGTALLAAQHARHALNTLMINLQVRLHWPEVSAPPHLPSTDPPVTEQEDAEFSVRRDLDENGIAF